ncbi:MAG: hypothetical protein IAF94_23135 [Pirellulaceae bacterium]|nr:hypothetical protein [Pirellulaceae bacterium]
MLPHIFLHDTWISATEILPSNPRVVHHCNMAYYTLGQDFDAGNFITATQVQVEALAAELELCTTRGERIEVLKRSLAAQQKYEKLASQVRERCLSGERDPQRQGGSAEGGDCTGAGESQKMTEV